MPQESTTLISKTELKNAFEGALSLHQEKKLDEATTAYLKLVTESQTLLAPNQSSVIYQNLAQIAFEKGDYLKAYIWAKKSISLNGHNQFAAETLKIVTEKFSPVTLAHQISNYEQFQRVISYTPTDFWYLLSITLFLVLLKVLASRLIAFKSKVKKSDILSSKTILFIIFAATLVTFWITYARNEMAKKRFGLVTEDLAKIQTAPGENKTVIFEAKAGLEVEIISVENDFYQIRYPGAFSGWIQKSQLETLGP